MKSITAARDSGCWHGDQLDLIFHTRLSYLCGLRKIPLNLWNSHCACRSTPSHSVNVFKEKHLYLKEISENKVLSTMPSTTGRDLWIVDERGNWLCWFISFFMMTSRVRTTARATVCPPAHLSRTIIPTPLIVFLMELLEIHTFWIRGPRSWRSVPACIGWEARCTPVHPRAITHNINTHYDTFTV